MCNRCTEQGHNAVIGELSDGAFISMYLLAEEGEASACERKQVFRIEALGQRTVTHDLRTQHGDLFTLAFQGAAYRLGLVGQVAGWSDLRGRGTQVGVVNGRHRAEGTLYPGQQVVRRSGCARRGREGLT